MSRYTITTQKALRAAFWEAHEGLPNISRKKITNYSGNGKMFNTDTRCAFHDWKDALQKDETISQALCQRALL